MSYRVHVVGAFNATASEFIAALDATSSDGNGSARFRTGSSGPWQWATASVWHVDGAQIDRALTSLSVPSLRVTSSDAVLWTLTLCSSGKPAFRGVHYFSHAGMACPEPAAFSHETDGEFPEGELDEVAGINRYIPALDFLWDAEEEARLRKEHEIEEKSTIPGLSDYADYGVALPSQVIEQMRKEPHRADYDAFMAHGVQIVEAFAEYGIPIDRSAVLALLTTEPLKESESDSDLGNMPRFLKVLGLEGVFQDPMREEGLEEHATADAEAANNEFSWRNFPPGKLVQDFDVLRADHPLTEIADGPVRVSDPALLHLLAHLLSEDPTTLIAIELLQSDTQLNRSWEELHSLEVRRAGVRWEFCFETPHWWYSACERTELEENAITTSLAALPDGAQLEMAFAVAGLAEKCHRYAGTYRDGQLELMESYPPLSAEILNEALALIEKIFESKPIELTSEEEINAVRRDYKRSNDENPRIRNGKIKPEYGTRDGVIQTLLLERFAGIVPWDIAGARARIESEWDDHDRLCRPAAQTQAEPEPEAEEGSSEELLAFQSMMERLQQASDERKQSRVVPHREEILYEGRTGKFFRANMSDLPHLSQQTLQDHDLAMASLGFQSLGDSVGEVDGRQEITRLYAGHPHAIGLLSHRNANNQMGWAQVSHGMVSVDFSNGTKEFQTHFDDGTVLATTSIDATNSKPEVGVYIRCYEDVPLSVLWEKHQDGVRRFQEHRHTHPIDHSRFRELQQVVALIDQLISRFLGGG